MLCEVRRTYNYLLTIKPSRYDDSFIAEFTRRLDSFFAALVSNGLILDKWRNSSVIDRHYECRVTAFDTHSLDEDNFNTDTRVALIELTKMCEFTPRLEYVGINCDLDGSCSCEKPTHLALYADMEADTSPIICCDCGKGFPLRRFRLNGKFDNFNSLLEWQQLYRSFRTQFRCGVGETFAYMMLHRFDSQLSIEGRALAQKLENSCGRVVYYYLMKTGGMNAPTCPECGKPWKSVFPDAVGFGYCCDDCRLVSNDPPTRVSPYGELFE